MAQFAILRISKLKTWRTIRQAGAHNLRLMKVPNANPEAAPPSLLYGNKNLGDAVAKRISTVKVKPRKDAVLATEIVLTGSPEAMAAKTKQELKQWEQANLNWLVQKFGENLVQVVRHDDETTPHLHAVVVPITPDGKLAAKRFWGEASGLSALQTEYSVVMKPYGLERGVKGSKAKHRDIKSFYGAIANMPKLPEMPEMPKRPRIEEKANILSHIKASTVVAAFRAWRKQIYLWVKEVKDLLRKTIAENELLKQKLASLEAQKLSPMQEASLKRRARRNEEAYKTLELIKKHNPEELAKLIEQSEKARAARRAALKAAYLAPRPTPKGERDKRAEELTELTNAFLAKSLERWGEHSTDNTEEPLVPRQGRKPRP